MTTIKGTELLSSDITDILMQRDILSSYGSQHSYCKMFLEEKELDSFGLVSYWSVLSHVFWISEEFDSYLVCRWPVSALSSFEVWEWMPRQIHYQRKLTNGFSDLFVSLFQISIQVTILFSKVKKKQNKLFRCP